MAETSASEASPSFQLNSYQTALCVTPRSSSNDSLENINRLRALYDGAYGKWPAHVNVVYPFVPVHQLPEAVKRIREELATIKWEADDANIHLRLNVADYFSLRRKNTVHLAPHNDRTENQPGLRRLRHTVLKALGIDTETEYKPHMTIGQTSHNPELLSSLLSKARMLVPFSCDVDQLEVFVRDESGKMCFREALTLDGQRGVSAECEQDCSGQFEQMRISGQSLAMEERTAYRFFPEDESWKPAPPLADSDPYQDEIIPERFAVSSYNVLVESADHNPHRYPALVRNILSDSARADIIVLQEVCDSFLAYLLSDDAVRRAYPFTTHGPPGQNGIAPLPSIRNIVVLSQRNVKWNWVPFGARHKGSVILEVDGVGRYDDDDNFYRLVLAGVHLTAGLTNDGIESKKTQLQGLFSILSKNYPENPLVVAGDFNIATSAISIEQALKDRKISPKAYEVQLSLEHLLSDAHLSDVWYMARIEGGNVESPFGLHAIDDICEGEQGATFDPTTNPLALESAKTGNETPQRYDRILTKSGDLLSVSSFNMFGFPDHGVESDDENDFSHFGSDHWGIRATFRLGDSKEQDQSSNAVLSTIPPFQKAPGNLASNEDLRSCITSCGMLPTDEDVKKRKEVFELVRSILTYGALPESAEYEVASQSAIPMQVVAVGSQGFNVWNSSSDVDVLCVGSISSKTFFTLAVQRLNKASNHGVRILRRVKAASGTMLEINVHDIKLDIQYSPAAKIVERWSDLSKLPPDDPLFDLSIHSLTKLQPYRDMTNLLRTIPDLAVFRTAHRFIRAWAKHRGIYAAKFGFLGGIHITMMLSRICKLYFHDAPVLTAADIICTFFRHYAEFDWDNEIMYDPFFFKNKPRYRRYPNEPMVILTLHAPIINVARAVSIPSQRTIVEELKRADRLLSGEEMLWSAVISGSEQGSVADLDEGAHEFLKDYSSYIKVNVQYWGLSLAKGSALVGWLESRCLRLLVDLDRKLPEIHTRIWPARFTSRDTITSPADQEYQGCYLIGLARKDNGETEPKSKDERKQAHDSLLAALERFTAQLQGEDKYFDSSLAWIDATHVKQGEVKDLVLDKREWGDYVVLDAVGDDDSEEDESEDDLIDPDVEELAAKQKANKANKYRQTASGKSGRKLRPATDILSRLRWDPAFDSGDYIIGYDDRFLGEMEMPLENWKGDQTHEDFIPMHRVLYFKRKTDGVIVWDRRTRRDEIFRSGAGAN